MKAWRYHVTPAFDKHSRIIAVSRFKTQGVWVCKNTLYKNIEAQILDLEILKLNFFGKCLC